MRRPNNFATGRCPRVNGAGAGMTTRIKCLQCVVRRTAPCSALTAETANALARIVHRRRISAGQILYGGAQRVTSCAIIIQGVVKVVSAHPDGRNQIVGLQFPSDFVGRPYVEASPMMAEAATDLEVCSFSGSTFENLMEQHPDLERTILRRTLDDLDAAREWMFMIARKTAEERVASLLLMMARKMRGERDEETSLDQEMELDLPLSRTEIAECLGMRLETVSRQFAALKAQGIIATGRRRGLKFCDLAELTRRAQGAVEV